jgi:hypothetical protein
MAPLANTLQYPKAPLPLGITGTTGAPGPGFIASASPLTFRSNINEDGTFPTAPGATADERQDIMVHISPTSGSSIIRGGVWKAENAEFDPTYGLNVTTKGVQVQQDVFETAIQEPIGSQFMANLQDLVDRSIVEVEDEYGNILTPREIRDYEAGATAP